MSLRLEDLLAVEPELSRLEVPTLMVWGTADAFFELSWSYWLKDLVPGVTDLILGVTDLIPGVTDLIPGVTDLIPGVTDVVEIEGGRLCFATSDPRNW